MRDLGYRVMTWMEQSGVASPLSVCVPDLSLVLALVLFLGPSPSLVVRARGLSRSRNPSAQGEIQCLGQEVWVSDR